MPHTIKQRCGIDHVTYCFLHKLFFQLCFIYIIYWFQIFPISYPPCVIFPPPQPRAMKLPRVFFFLPLPVSCRLLIITACNQHQKHKWRGGIFFFIVVSTINIIDQQPISHFIMTYQVVFLVFFSFFLCLFGLYRRKT